MTGFAFRCYGGLLHGQDAPRDRGDGFSASDARIVDGERHVRKSVYVREGNRWLCVSDQTHRFDHLYRPLNDAARSAVTVCASLIGS